MKKKSKSKLKLEDLQVQSFVTSLNEEDAYNMVGGSGYQGCPSHYQTCQEAGNFCPMSVGGATCYPNSMSNACNGVTCIGSGNPAWCAQSVICPVSQTIACPGTGGGCFLAGTLVNTSSQEYINIEDLKIGDYVLSYDYKQNKLMNNKVANLHEIIQPRYYIINENIKTTANHPFLVNGKWLEVKDIAIGDKLVDTNFKSILVDSLKIVENESKVYNLTVENAHTFFIHDILVHNKTLASGRTAACAGGNGGLN